MPTRVAPRSVRFYLAAMFRRLEPGDRFPDFVLPLSGRPTRLYARVGGRPVVLVLSRCEAPQTSITEIADRADVVVVTTGSASSDDHFVDKTGEVIDNHVPPENDSMTYVLDANLRVVGPPGHGQALDDIEALLETIDLSDAPTRIRRQAPVLLVDRVLDAERCAFLMKLWERGGAIETGVEQSTGDGRGEVVSGALKSRQDHVVEDEKLIRLLTQSIGRKLLEEIERSFVYKPTRFEGFKIACYDAAASGFFHAHRDNLSPATAHRRLAVSLNLNDTFEGGELRFPEFSNDRYCPAAGSALVFSCAHLHEVLPVTSGRRFTLLTFLYDESVQRKTSVDPFAV